MVSVWQLVWKGARDRSPGRLAVSLFGAGGRIQGHDPEHHFLRRLTIGLIAFLAIETAVTILDAASPPDLSRARRSSPVALDRRGQWLRALPVENGRWRIRADLDRTDPAFLRRVVAVEDQRFLGHPGVDARAVLRAAVSATLHG